MPTSAYASPNYDRRRSDSFSPSTSFGAPSMLVNGYHVNGNQRNVMSSDSFDHLSGSEVKRVVMSLLDEGLRLTALDTLSKIANSRPGRPFELAPMLWHTPGVVFILLQEVMSVYKILDDEDGLRFILRRVLNAICLLQCIAMHWTLRRLFVKAFIPSYLLPFLQMRVTAGRVEQLRLASLGVFAALVKAEDSEVIHYLLDSEVFGWCLVSMQLCTQCIKALVSLVIWKLLSNEQGLHHCCSFHGKFIRVLQFAVDQPSQLDRDTIRLIRNVVRSYFLLAEIPGAIGDLKIFFPLRFSSWNFLRQLELVDPNLSFDIRRLHDKIKAQAIKLGLRSS